MCIEHNSHFAVTIGLTADEAIKKETQRAPVDAELSIYRSNDKSGVYAKRAERMIDHEKAKTYWAVFTGRGSVAIDVANYPLIYIIKAEAENDRLWIEQRTRRQESYHPQGAYCRGEEMTDRPILFYAQMVCDALL